MTDASTGDVWGVADSPRFHLKESTDGGASFGPEHNPSGSLHFSDWAMHSDYIFGAGTEGSLYRIPVASPGTSDTISGATRADPTDRSITVDPSGNAYTVASDGGQIVLERVLDQTTSIASSRTLANSANGPSVEASDDSQTAVVSYTKNNSVFVTVQSY